MVAPDRNRSGISESMKLLDEVRANRLSLPLDDVQAYGNQAMATGRVILAHGSLFGESFGTPSRVRGSRRPASLPRR